MEENTERKEISLVVWLGILVALVMGVILIFTMLEIAIPKAEIPPAQQMIVSTQETETPEQPAPKFCPDCGAGLPDSFAWGKFCPYCGELVEWESGA